MLGMFLDVGDVEDVFGFLDIFRFYRDFSSDLRLGHLGHGNDSDDSGMMTSGYGC